MPNALFDLVDCCVEIPQLGVVRSLNVHVSGAIAVWMFARQVLLRAAGPAGDIHAEFAAVKADSFGKSPRQFRLFKLCQRYRGWSRPRPKNWRRGPPPAAAGESQNPERKRGSPLAH